MPSPTIATAFPSSWKRKNKKDLSNAEERDRGMSLPLLRCLGPAANVLFPGRDKTNTAAFKSFPHHQTHLEFLNLGSLVSRQHLGAHTVRRDPGPASHLPSEW